MKAPDNALAPLKQMDGAPLFNDHWQAQALAMADTLVTAGILDRDEWSRELGAAIRRLAGEGAPDTIETYYRAVMSALESLLARAGEADKEEIDQRQLEWKRAYLNTPHGQPVELSAGQKK